MATSIGWPDHYRPKTLDEMALAPELRQRFEWYLACDVLPRHLILHGRPGFGKTTIARIIQKVLYHEDGWPRVQRVSAAQTGGVDTIRDRVINFMRILPSPRLVIIEEASGLSREAQEALRVPLEDRAELCRVIFITNRLDKFDVALRSRCKEIEMGRPPIEECARVLGSILEREGVSVEPATVLAFTQGYFAAATDGERRDLRSLLETTEHAIATEGSLPVPPEPESSSATLLLVELLADINGLFDAEEANEFSSVVLVQKLVALEPSRWKEQGLTPSRLSRLLQPLGIRPKQVWIDPGSGIKTNKQGYQQAQFEDAFAKYL